MKVLRTVAEIRAALDGHDSIGFVPTMGAFHEGHLELMRRSRQTCGTTVVSVFVNPLQFGDSIDFDKYPRDEERDFRMASDVGVDYLYAPSTDQILLGQVTTVHVSGVSESWEGASRPGHFDGVATIVLKLFNIVNPTVAFFGLKDLQQCAVVQTMVANLNLDIHIETVSTVREDSGLALSSRNQRLTPQGLARAPVLYKSLHDGLGRIEGQKEPVSKVLESVKRLLEDSGFVVDYVALVDPNTMVSLQEPVPGNRMIAAVALEGVRLIDNVALREE